MERYKTPDNNLENELLEKLALRKGRVIELKPYVLYEDGRTAESVGNIVNGPLILDVHIGDPILIGNDFTSTPVTKVFEKKGRYFVQTTKYIYEIGTVLPTQILDDDTTTHEQRGDSSIPPEEPVSIGESKSGKLADKFLPDTTPESVRGELFLGKMRAYLFFERQLHAQEDSFSFEVDKLAHEEALNEVGTISLDATPTEKFSYLEAYSNAFDKHKKKQTKLYNLRNPAIIIKNEDPFIADDSEEDPNPDEHIPYIDNEEDEIPLIGNPDQIPAYNGRDILITPYDRGVMIRGLETLSNYFEQQETLPQVLIFPDISARTLASLVHPLIKHIYTHRNESMPAFRFIKTHRDDKLYEIMEEESDRQRLEKKYLKEKEEQETALQTRLGEVIPETEGTQILIIDDTASEKRETIKKIRDTIHAMNSKAKVDSFAFISNEMGTNPTDDVLVGYSDKRSRKGRLSKGFEFREGGGLGGKFTETIGGVTKDFRDSEKYVKRKLDHSYQTWVLADGTEEKTKTRPERDFRIQLRKIGERFVSNLEKKETRS